MSGERRWKAAAKWPPGARRALAALAAGALAAGGAQAQCNSTVTAEVVALDHFIFYNRLGAHDPEAMIFALKQDVVPEPGYSGLQPGRVRLRDGKRPRPLTLRVQERGCLVIQFTNLLDPVPQGGQQPHTRAASVHVVGMQLRNSISDDGSSVGNNPSSLAEPGQTRTYTLYGEKEGTYLLYSTGATTGGEGDGGQISRGLFGAVNVEPRQSEWYRSQLTAADLRLAQKKDNWGNPIFTPGGQPVINYDALYPTGHPLAGRTILKMVQNGKIVHSDLNAIITGPNKGNFPANTYPAVRVSPDRHRPFREFTIIFHDEVGLVQAFDSIFEDPRFEHTLHSGRDAFAVNYGTGGIGAEVLGNRFGVGPMWDCNECKYEEFFLSSWTVGDPAMVVDVPADTDANGDGIPDPGPKATKVFFPDDPSNVYHSYMNDHVKFRNLHAGPKEHHIFHLHAHQWLHTPNSDNSSYLDSQAIGPGGGYTYEVTFNGGGNRNKTPGDAIFHCHFYPHFAQGMWALWRVHDVFETGTTLANGIPTPGSRKLPDGEIAAGTPIPGVVPIPNYALAPMPTSTQPGYPFFIPGIAGHRPPKPPLDTQFDGGLHRHVVRDGTAVFPALNRLDFHKDNVTIVADSLDELGTPLELNAMAFHALRSHSTWRVNPVTFAVTSDTFITNGRPQVAGAPYADPCVDDFGRAQGSPRTYKSANLQIDAKYNKALWHHPQHRMSALWVDVDSFRLGIRPPEPLFFRANTNDCITFHLVNLIPKDYLLDDFQVRSPTDVTGQHIHLVKFDVTSSDGAANGFNYEDGSFSPGETRERVAAIRLQNNCQNPDPRDGTFVCPLAEAHPFFGNGPNNDWIGAQETVQRWYADSIRNVQGRDRTLRTVFTHDHFGPSTHQQAGLYAGLVVEPLNSQWRDPESGIFFGTRVVDGGPTSWRADILTANPDSSYREFNLQVADFTLAYENGNNGFPDPDDAINPPGKFQPNPPLPFLLRPPIARNACPNEVDPPPCPELISADDPGTMTVNYRNEPIALRVRNPGTNTQAGGDAGDLSLAFASDVDRADNAFDNVGPYRPLTNDVLPRDPFTPLMRVYEDDRVQIRVLVGAHEEGHMFSVHGTEWLFEPSDSASGYRNGQGMGISEHFEFLLPPLADNLDGDQADYLYQAGSATDDLWNGIWGIIRAYRNLRPDLIPLPMNTDGADALAQATAKADAQGISAAIEAGDPNARFVGTTKEDSVQWETEDASTPILGPDGGSGEVTIVGKTDESGRFVGFDTIAPPPPSEKDTMYYDTTGTAGADTSTTDAPVEGGGGGPIKTETGDVHGTAGSGGFMIEEGSGGGGVWYGGPPPPQSFSGICPTGAPVRQYDISAISVWRSLPGGKLIYNSRTLNGGPLNDPSAIMYVRTSDLQWVNGFWQLKNSAPKDPLVIRAAAGDCLQVRLRNRLALPLPDPDGFNTFPMIVDRFNANQVDPSRQVGLHPQLVAFDPTRSDGSKVGLNPRTVVQPGGVRDYQWYAGQVVVENGQMRAFPVEYGAINLVPSDRLKHPNKGAIASLVVEPQHSFWYRINNTNAQAVVYHVGPGHPWYQLRLFREFVLQYQDDVNLRFGSTVTLPLRDCDADDLEPDEIERCEQNPAGDTTFLAGSAIPNTAEAEDPEDSGQKAFNYRTEPMWFRMGFAPNASLGFTRTLDFRTVLRDQVRQVNGSVVNLGRPKTPIFNAGQGNPVRFRVLEAGGHARNHVFNLHGHIWEELPFNETSTALASNPLSEWKGARDMHGPSGHWNLLLRNNAGGKFGRTGEYLYRDQPSFQFDGGLWGLFKVIQGWPNDTINIDCVWDWWEWEWKC
ncbi:MAG TPA: hypothetical protein VFX98_18585 [Longimicrobiaceae bacterium]|nr:hypothetical protein [Longimicrobiaceae bacterium]